MQAEGKYKVFQVDLSDVDWDKQMKEAFDEVFLRQTEFYQTLQTNRDKEENK